MGTIADDHISRLSTLAMQRTDFEQYWQQARELAAPEATDFTSAGFLSVANNAYPYQNASAARTSKKLYDSTAVWCADRLASGIEALIVPQSEYWHGYSITDLTKEDASDEEKLFLERLRNLTFKLRYDADTGWIVAVQTALRRCVVFGNAFVFTDDAYNPRSFFRYRYLPLNECYAAENHQGEVDCFYRFYQLTARQAMQKFGEKVSAEVKRAADSASDSERKFSYIQCISARGDYGLPSEGVKKAPWGSIHIEYDHRLVVGESGFHEFPIMDFRWMPEPGKVWAEGPVMKCLADIQSLNQLAKNELVAGMQATNPPLLVANAGIMNRPSAAPGSVVVGGMSAQGQRLVEPMFNGQRQDFATTVLEAKRSQVKESLYINLFALLVQNPQMSATEAMIRANEKGELLGPAGARLQQSVSRNNERELGIMRRHGVFAPGSAFVPPRSMHGSNIATHFSSPLDRYRKGKEVEGTLQLLNTISPIAQLDPSIVDNIDGDETVRGLAERVGMPVKFVRNLKQVQMLRSQRQRTQQLAQASEISKNFAAAGAQGVDALQGLRQSGTV